MSRVFESYIDSIILTNTKVTIFMGLTVALHVSFGKGRTGCLAVDGEELLMSIPVWLLMLIPLITRGTAVEHLLAAFNSDGNRPTC